MDGLAATRAIRSTSDVNAVTPIVALSANVMPEHLRACHEAGMDDHIGKPIDAGDLLGKVARWTAPQVDEGQERRAP
jgi:CheY-like chemotaxis protein